MTGRLTGTVTATAIYHFLVISVPLEGASDGV